MSRPHPLEYTPCRLAAVDRIRRAARLWSKRMLVASTCVAAAGYVSDWTSRAACERRTARWVAATPMAGRPFRAVSDRYRGSPGLFAAAGVASSTIGAPVGAAWPWAEVGPGDCAVPFLVEVPTGWCVAPLYGKGDVHRYLCLFGFTLAVGHRVTSVS